MSIGVRGVDRHLAQELLQVTLVGRVLSSVTACKTTEKKYLGEGLVHVPCHDANFEKCGLSRLRCG